MSDVSGASSRPVDPGQVQLPKGDDEEALQSAAQDLASQGELEETPGSVKTTRKTPVAGSKTSESQAKSETGHRFVDEAVKAEKNDNLDPRLNGPSNLPKLDTPIGAQVKTGNSFFQMGAAIGAQLGALAAARMNMEIRFLDQQSKTELAQLVFDLEQAAAAIKRDADVAKAEAQFKQGLTQAIGGGIQAGTAGVSLGMQGYSLQKTRQANKRYNDNVGEVNTTSKAPPSNRRQLKQGEFESAVETRQTELKNMPENKGKKPDELKAQAEQDVEARFDNYRKESEGFHKTEVQKLKTAGERDTEASQKARHLEMDLSSPDGLKHTSKTQKPPSTFEDVKAAHARKEPTNKNSPEHARWKEDGEALDKMGPEDRQKAVRQAAKEHSTMTRNAQHSYQSETRSAEIMVNMSRSLTEGGQGLGHIIQGSGQMMASEDQMHAAELEYMSEQLKASAKLLENLLRMIDTNIGDLQQSINKALEAFASVSQTYGHMGWGRG